MSKSIGKILLLNLLLFSTLQLSGQLNVGLSFNRSRYMRYEHIFACVTIRNDSGRPLLFGQRPELQGFILFDIRDNRNRPVPKREGKEFSAQGLYIAPGEVKNLVIPLHQYYKLDKAGDFKIHVYVSHNRIPREYRSKDILIRIFNGAVIWEKSVGLPSRTGDNMDELIERKYSISKVEGERVKYYYLTVEDDGKIYAVTRLGMVLAHMKFDAQVDMLSRIHLLMPVGPRVYHYLAFNANGMNLENSYWKTTDTEPVLYRDPKSGTVVRVGGAPARKGVDYADPKAGTLSVSELLDQNNQNVPLPPKASGVVDLGDGVLPVKSGDED